MIILFKRRLEEDAPVLEENWPEHSEADGMRHQLMSELQDTLGIPTNVLKWRRRLTGNQHPGRRFAPRSMVYYDFTIDFPHYEKSSAEICELFDGTVYGKWEILETKAAA